MDAFLGGARRHRSRCEIVASCIACCHRRCSSDTNVGPPLAAMRLKLSTSADTNRLAQNSIATSTTSTKYAAAHEEWSRDGARPSPTLSIATYMMSCQLSPVLITNTETIASAKLSKLNLLFRHVPPAAAHAARSKPPPSAPDTAAVSSATEALVAAYASTYASYDGTEEQYHIFPWNSSMPMMDRTVPKPSPSKQTCEMAGTDAITAFMTSFKLGSLCTDRRGLNTRSSLNDRSAPTLPNAKVRSDAATTTTSRMLNDDRRYAARFW